MLSPLVLIMSTSLDQEFINQYIDKIKSVFKGQPKSYPPPQLNGKTFVFGPYPHKDSIISISKMLPAADSSELEAQQTAFVYLFEKLLDVHFFSRIRRSGRIAYNVSLNVWRHSSINYIEFFIQTSYSLQDAEDRIYKFIRNDAPNYLDSLTDEELLTVKNSLFHSLDTTKFDFWKTSDAILSQRPNFDFMPKVVEFLESLTSAQTIRAELRAILKIISDPKNGFKVIVLGKQ